MPALDMASVSMFIIETMETLNSAYIERVKEIRKQLS